MSDAAVVKVKICGIRTLEVAREALDAGADAIGLNFVAESPRYLADEAEAARIAEACAKAGALAVGLFTTHPAEEAAARARRLGLPVVQVHAPRPPAYAHALRKVFSGQVWKACRVAGAADLQQIDAEGWPADAWLLDALVKGGPLGGTGEAFDWTILRNWPRDRPLVLAGGLHPDNVAEAVREVRPEWVDVASGVESARGVKDSKKIRLFIQRAKNALHEG